MIPLFVPWLTVLIFLGQKLELNSVIVHHPKHTAPMHNHPVQIVRRTSPPQRPPPPRPTANPTFLPTAIPPEQQRQMMISSPKYQFISQTLERLKQERKKQCGVKFFQDFHQHFQTKRKNCSWKEQKTILSVPSETGLSDRIVGTVANFLLAILTDHYFIYSVRDTFQADVLTTSFEMQNIEVFQQLPIQPPSNFIYPEMKFNFTDPVTNLSFHVHNYMLDQKMIRFIREGNQNIRAIVPSLPEHVLLISHLGFTLGIYENHTLDANYLLNELGLTSQLAFGCLFDYLFQPKPEIFYFHHFSEFQVLTMQNHHTGSDILKIGIHLRVGDRMFRGRYLGTEIHQYTGLFECAQQIESFALMKGNYSSAIWYIISDSSEFRHFALSKYGGKKILTSTHLHLAHSGNSKTPLHGLYSAAAEWWMYSLTDYRISSSNGGFSVAAGSRLPFEGRTYRVNPLDQKDYIHCGEDDYRHLNELSKDFPGI